MSDDQQQTPPGDSPEKRRRLPVNGLTGSPKQTLARHANKVIGVLHFVINELLDAAASAKAAGSRSVQVDALAEAGRLSLRSVELVVGRRTSLNLNVRSQEDLTATASFWRSLPPEQRAALDAAMDAYEQVQRGNVLPAKALSSMPIADHPPDSKNGESE
jgi:hypothetical protein